MRVEFAFGDTGVRSKGTLDTGLPLLRGLPREVILAAAEPAEAGDGVSLWRGAGGVVGLARMNPRGDLEAATVRTYGAILRACRGLNLYRIWNIVPRINGQSPGGLENYQAFCRGRSLAFESAFGADFSGRLPAASAVGTDKEDMTVAFLAGGQAARHHENPAQVPAYRYPPEHGPRPPCFSRATVVEGGDTIDGFVSGTSAVVGHETVAPNDTARQLECTFANLRLISRVCGLGDRFGEGGSCRRHFKVYLRNAGDLTIAALQMRSRILARGDRATYLRAEICRSALNVEIEVAVRGAKRI